MPKSGPTQGAERHEAKLNQWKSHPQLARLVRALIVLAPIASSIAFTWWMGRVLPPERLGVGRWAWIAIVFVAANVLLLAMSRVSKRFVPLVAVMKLTLVFPDTAPSRTKAALRHSNSRAMLRNIDEARARGDASGAVAHGDYLVQLLKEVNDHDRLTRGHSERVRAYAELLGEELGLRADDMNKLRWAALLHDVGKLSVPHDVLNKDGRPTDAEWKILQGHPAAAIPLLEPLRPWLGEWIHAADQHHCRFDGNGYPHKLAGTDITLAGRLVAIADAYDVMTSARSYKQPLSPEIARQELTECAGTQFDPTLVKAFLRIGLNRLRRVAGPLTWLANLTGSAQVPVPAATTMTTGAWSAGMAAVSIVVASVSGLIDLGDAAPAELAFIAPVVVANDSEATGSQNEPIIITLTATGIDVEPTFSVSGSAHGTVSSPGPVLRSDSGDETTWATAVTYSPAPEHVGEDGFTFEVCDPTASCDVGRVTIMIDGSAAPMRTTTTASPTTTEPATTTAPSTAVVQTAVRSTAAPQTATPSTRGVTTTEPSTTTTAPINGSPSANDDAASTDEDTSILVDVLDNDTDPETDTITISGVGDPLRGTARIESGRIRYTPQSNYFGPDQLSYTIADGHNAPVAAFLTITVRAVNDRPEVSAPNASVTEAAVVGTSVLAVVMNDVDGDALSASITAGDPTGRFAVTTDGVVEVAAALDRETTPSYSLEITVSDGTATTSVNATVTILDVDEAPTAGDDTSTTPEDTARIIDLGTNDSDPEGQALTWNTPGTSMGGGSVLEIGGVVSYTPPTDFEGTDTFTYTVADPAGNVSAPATVTIVVDAVNDPPVANDDTLNVGQAAAATTVDVRLNDTDTEAGALTVTTVANGARGTTVDNGDGTITYTHDGSQTLSDTFSYTVTDVDGAADTATVVVTVVPAEDFDGVPAGVDTCPFIFDPDQRDTDGDGIGDACDPFPTTTSTGTFTDSGAALDGISETFALALGDLDGDGELDAIFAHRSGAKIHINDGSGGFSATAQTLSSGATDAVALADLDGDGDLDAILANNGGNDRVWLNDGAGAFSSGQSLGPPNDSAGVAVGDIDGDGDLDLVFAYLDAADAIWLNNGSGSFTNSGQSLDATKTTGVALGDVDGDLDLDIVFANENQDNTVWLNDGSGVFANSGQVLGSRKSHDVAMADFDDDGDLDIVFAEDGDLDHVWLNDGGGVFTDTGQTLGLGHSHAVKTGDIDGDGDIDLVVGDHTGANTVWLNDGSGSFTDSLQRLGGNKTEMIGLGDLDGDGRLDLVTGNDDQPNRVWFNS